MSHVTRKRVMAHMWHALSFMLYVTCFISPVGLTLYVWVTSRVNESCFMCHLWISHCIYELWVTQHMYELYRYSVWLHIQCVTVYMNCESHIYVWVYIQCVTVRMSCNCVYVWLTQSHTIHTDVHCIYELWVTLICMSINTVCDCTYELSLCIYVTYNSNT